jgi:xanthine dehydrogenase molybdopterin-binding subunit B
MFTLLRNGNETHLDTLLDVVQIAHADDPVYVPGRGWMTVGDLRWDMDTTADAEAWCCTASGRTRQP